MSERSPQDIVKKNNTSNTINKATPIFNPPCTAKIQVSKLVQPYFMLNHRF
jgi:hypothetical protein